MTFTISVRLSDDVLKQLDNLSKETQRTKTFIIRAALEKYFKEYADYQIALDRLNDKDDAIISSPEMRTRLGL